MTKVDVGKVHRCLVHLADRGKGRAGRILDENDPPIQVGIHQIHPVADSPAGYRLDPLCTRYVVDARLRSWVLRQSRLSCVVPDLLDSRGSHAQARES